MEILELLKQILEGIGIEDWLTQVLLTILAVIMLIRILFFDLFRTVKSFINYLNNRRDAKDLHPFFTITEVKNATRLFIETKAQNIAPSNEDEPGGKFIVLPKIRLIPEMINNAFKYDSDDNKYYMIFAGSGMGKTTFMINLYLRYKRKISWPWRKYAIKLIPLGNPSSFDYITKIENKENTILLLDAFDEDNEAIKDYEQKLKKILESTKDFREIVISCRTQFFPSEEKEPYNTGLFKYGPNQGEYKFQKMYLSVLSEKDIEKYLVKKFSTLGQKLKSFLLSESSRYSKAYQIVMLSPNLMLRPMLLSHIEDLLDSENNYDYSFQVYKVLINKWIERESRKHGIVEKYGRENYKDLLYQFSKSFAINLYLKRDSRDGSLSIPQSENIENSDLQLKDLEDDFWEIKKEDQTTRTLLNRNAAGEYKFSHKSIFEYFIALEIFENEKFRREYEDSKDLDNVKNFLLEMVTSSKLTNDEISRLISQVNIQFTGDELANMGVGPFMPLEKKLIKTHKSNLKSKFGDFISSLIIVTVTVPIFNYTFPKFVDLDFSDSVAVFGLLGSIIVGFGIMCPASFFAILNENRRIKELEIKLEERQKAREKPL